MTLYRENAIWASPDGGYKMGLYDFEYVNLESPEFNSEWDVKYNYNAFNKVFTGVSPHDCIAQYCHANASAGSYTIYEANPRNQQQIAKLEQMYTEYIHKNGNNGIYYMSR